MRSVYYNDNDPGICAWLRELIKAKLLPEGNVVDILRRLKATDSS
jgi:hypothetical protein